MEKLIWIIWIIILYSCNHTPKPFPDSFTKTDHVILQNAFFFPTDSISKPSIIFSFDKYIILIEDKLDSLITIYNMDNKSFKRIQKKGRGPGETLLIRQIQSFKENSFYTFDPFQEAITIYSNIDDLITSRQHKTDIKQISEIFYNNGTQIISKTGNIQRFTIQDSSRKFQHEFGKVFKYADHSEETIAYIDGFTEISFDLKKMVWFSYMGDIFELYDFNDSNNIKLIKREIGIFPHLKHKEKGKKIIPVYTPKTKLGANSITSSNQYIFVLYNEHDMKDQLTVQDNVYLSDKILVYDWDGNPIRMLSLNQKVRAITYNKQNNCIYCLSNNENKEPIIVFFDATN